MDTIRKPTAAMLGAEYRGYTTEQQRAKTAMHRASRLWLMKVATEVLGLKAGEFDLRCNQAGPAVSGESTLHTEHLYLQLAEHFCGRPGLTLMYRTCKGRKDYTGGVNNFVHVRDLLKEDVRERVTRHLRELQDRMRLV